MLASGSIAAAPGDIDTTFGTQGVARIAGRPDTAATALRVDSNGRLLAGGSSSLARFLANGQLDTTFGTQGVAQLELNASVTSSSAMAIWQGDSGRVLTLMSGPIFCLSLGQCSIYNLFSSDYAAARRFTSGGVPEALPGDAIPGQSAVMDVRRFERNLLWTASGELLVATLRYDILVGNTVRLLRYGPDGNNSDWFNTAALPMPAQNCLAPESGLGAFPVSVAGTVDSSRRVTLAIRRVTQLGSVYSLCLMRFLSDGSLDSTFGSGGLTLLENSSSLALSLRQPLRLFTRPDQTLRVLLTEGTTSDARNPVWLSFTANGALDTTRGNGTGIEAMVPTPLASIRDVLQLPDGRFALTGYLVDGTTNQPQRAAPLVATYGADGSTPDFFGAGSGATTRSLVTGQGRLEPNVIAAAADGRIHVAGSWVTSANPAGEFAVVRLEGLPAPVPPQSSSGGGGGGGCGSLDPNGPRGPVDPSLLLMVLMALTALGWRSRRNQ